MKISQKIKQNIICILNEFQFVLFPHFALEKSMPWPELQHKISIEIASPRGREQNHQPPQIPPPPRLSPLLTLERHHYMAHANISTTITTHQEPRKQQSI